MAPGNWASGGWGRLPSLIRRNVHRRLRRLLLLATAVGLAVAVSFLGTLLLLGLQGSMVLSFARLGADWLVLPQGTMVNHTQALLAVEPDAPPLPADALDQVQRVPGLRRVSGQRALRLVLDHHEALTVVGIDPATDFTVQPWLSEAPPLAFQDGSVILGAQRRGRPGDRLNLLGHTFRIHGRLASTGVPSHETGLFITLADLARLVPPTSGTDVGVNGLLLEAEDRTPPELLRFRLLGGLTAVDLVGGHSLATVMRQGLGAMQPLLGGLAIAALICLGLLLGLHDSALITERRRELGLLLSLGMLPSQVGGLVVGEALVVSGLGAGTSLMVSWVLCTPLRQLLGDRLLRAGIPLQWPASGIEAAIAVALLLFTLLLAALTSGWAVGAVIREEPLRLVRGDD